MDERILLDFLARAEKLKCNTRHSWTSDGRRESVAEHTCRLCMFAWLLKDRFVECDMQRVIELCLFHDLGEAVAGDVPCFEKTSTDELTEEAAWHLITGILPEKEQSELLGILEELKMNQTKEAKLVHALDKMEAVIQHNEAPIETWLPLEYELQLTYGEKQTAQFPYTKQLREVLRQDTLRKIEKEQSAEKKQGYNVSKEKGKLSLKKTTELLHQSYWAKERSQELIKQTIENSVCYGVFTQEQEQVGFARVVTDYTTTFYLMDVIIDEKYRYQGLGTLLMEYIMKEVGHLHGILHTKDAQAFYRAYGFEKTGEHNETIMEKERET